jgi:hypothetical protein
MKIHKMLVLVALTTGCGSYATVVSALDRKVAGTQSHLTVVGNANISGRMAATVQGKRAPKGTKATGKSEVGYQPWVYGRK